MGGVGWGVIYFNQFLSAYGSLSSSLSLYFMNNNILTCAPECYFVMCVTSCCRKQGWSC